MFNVDFYILVSYLLPPFLQKKRLMLFLFSLISAINISYNEFMAQRTQTIFELSILPTVADLEYYLNYLFNNNEQGISIETIRITFEYLFTDSDNRNRYFFTENDYTINPLALYNYIYSDNEQGQSANFTIKIPTSLTIDEGIVRQSIEKYIVSGMSYIIERI